METRISQPQYVDPEVTEHKFRAMLSDFNANLNVHVSRGIFCRHITFPVVSLLVTVPQLKPPAIAFGVDIDFTNFDFEPPSVQFIDPFTGVRLKAGDAQIIALQANSIGPPMNLVQGMPGEPLFLCLPGIQEYHSHPAHSGDSWLLYRSRGEGTLAFIIDQLHKHSIMAITSYQMNLNIVMSGFGYDPNKLPR